jgi:hypothetical protein
MVEYHVVRKGVDEQQVISALSDLYAEIGIIEYWSNVSSIGQRIGERFGWNNTFGMHARGRRPSDAAERRLGNPSEVAVPPVQRRSQGATD